MRLILCERQPETARAWRATLTDYGYEIVGWPSFTSVLTSKPVGSILKSDGLLCGADFAGDIGRWLAYYPPRHPRLWVWIKTQATDTGDTLHRQFLARRRELAYPRLTYRDIILDPETQAIYQEGRYGFNSRCEYRLLAKLVANPHRVVSAEELLHAVYGRTVPQSPMATLEVHISNLRKKLGRQVIVNVKGLGYRLGT